MKGDNNSIRFWAMDWIEHAHSFVRETKSYLLYRNVEGRPKLKLDNFDIRTNVHRALLRLNISTPMLTVWIHANTRFSPDVFIHALADMNEGFGRLRTKEGPDLARIDRAYLTSVRVAETIVESLPEAHETNQPETKRTPGKKRSKDKPEEIRAVNAWHARTRGLTYREFAQEYYPGVCGDQIDEKSRELETLVKNASARRDRYREEKKREGVIACQVTKVRVKPLLFVDREFFSSQSHLHKN